MPLTSVLVTTRMMWDDDINPEGLSEQWKHSFSFGSSEVAPSSYGKDGKEIAVAKSEPFLKLDLFANFNQFVYDDSNPENPLGPRAVNTSNGVSQKTPNTDAFLLAWQVGARLNFPKTFYAQLAPTIYNYTGNGDSFNVHFQGGDPNLVNSATAPAPSSLGQNQTGINSLLIYDMPWEVGAKISQLNNLPVRLFGDFAVNFNGDDRASAAGHPGHGDQRYAVQAGAGMGQLKKKGDWQLDAYYQRIDQYALDPNLIDSDLFNQTLNLHGPVVRAGYMLSDAVWLNLTWGYAWRADKALGTGGVTDLSLNPIDQYQIFQADFNLKF
jgi:Putative porin